MINYFDIGVITKPQGIKGEVRVMPHTDDPERFALLDEVDIVFAHKPRETRSIENTWQRPPFVVIKLKGVDDRTAAEALTGAVIQIPPEKALPLAEGEYYIRDLLGMAVKDETGAALGVLTEVIHTGANDVYAVKTPAGEQFLLPAVKHCVLAVSVESRSMTVRVPEGLRD